MSKSRTIPGRQPSLVSLHSPWVRRKPAGDQQVHPKPCLDIHPPSDAVVKCLWCVGPAIPLVYMRPPYRCCLIAYWTLRYDQILALMSPEPVAKYPPVGLGATEMTEFLWPWSMSCVAPVRGSQNCTPRSLDPDMTHAASGVRATERTKS